MPDLLITSELIKKLILTKGFQPKVADCLDELRSAEASFSRKVRADIIGAVDTTSYALRMKVKEQARERLNAAIRQYSKAIAAIGKPLNEPIDSMGAAFGLLVAHMYMNEHAKASANLGLLSQALQAYYSRMSEFAAQRGAPKAIHKLNEWVVDPRTSDSVVVLPGTIALCIALFQQVGGIFRSKDRKDKACSVLEFYGQDPNHAGEFINAMITYGNSRWLDVWDFAYSATLFLRDIHHAM